MDHVALKHPHFFYTTAPLPCPYLEGRLERKLVTELAGPQGRGLHEALSRAGFRRSHAIAYAPACPNCRACIPVRIVVDAFKPDRTMRKILHATRDIVPVRGPARSTSEQYRLFTRYQDARHAGSDMALMGFYDYRSMIEDSPIDSFLVELRSPQNRLMGVCLGDGLSDGLSAVYSFYEIDDPKSSLGTRIVLWLIEEAKRLGLPYVYLGYWIAESRKMAYKTRFKPLEAFGPAGWEPL
ncbi:MAG: arginyltransferase [Rhodospirillales bacterium]|jgi:arginine-tRNA-protein transferase|nr:arginyltransferase [Rhodospirillales bacterium]MDK9720279.1 arginyltransferase [Rhodospirillales bacterium]